MHATEKLIRTQEEIRNKIILEDSLPEVVGRIGGVDQAFLNNRIISAAVVCDLDMNTIEKKHTITRVDFPYIPGFLSFREGYPIIKTFNKLDKKPDILLVDGNGILHPRGVGIASHIGVLLDIATIGVAKRLLCGETKEPRNVGDYSPVIYEDKIVGYTYKSKKKCRPIFISPGNKISLGTSLRTVKECIGKHKLPIPLKAAHDYASEIKAKLSWLV